ncbi:hypothetical protein AAFP30_05970 [Gordonia sp. CPCC 205515]|uniref:hypothetical protein n=1 Tax=Gordonia sp. CPCC 205515 TaxID=3140791 RepID=UPI003AF3EE20
MSHLSVVAIGMGTDASLTYVTHYNTWREMDHAVRFGETVIERPTVTRFEEIDAHLDSF